MTIGPSEKKPLVSVVIPSYNHELYVRAAIESVLDSSVKNFEILVVDDGSTDQSVKIVNEMKDPRLKLFTQKNMGAHEAINRGVSLAAAPWIAILNSDDRFHPRKLEMHLELHASNPHLEASASRVRYIYEDGKPVPSDGYLAWRYGEAKRSYSGGKSLWISLIQTNHLVTTSSLFIGKASLEEIGWIPPLRYNHDWFVFLTLAARGRFGILEEELVDYRRHSTNTITEDEDRAKIESLFVAEWHLNSVFSQQLRSVEIREAMNAIQSRPWMSYKLLLFLALWRRTCDNDLTAACSMFASRDNPILLESLRIMHEDLGRLNFKILTKKYLSSQWMGWADKLLRIWNRFSGIRS